MSFKRWEVGTVNKEAAKMLAEECDGDTFSALIAVSRGISDPSEYELMLSDEPLLCDPRELADISLAADFLNKAIKENKKIAVFGDYDCDGVTATAIMTDYLKGRGADVICYIPDRVSEGYGMSEEAVESIKNDGADVIVTVDNGISCTKEIDYANTLGIDVVVTDHHLPPKELPKAIAVVDPHREDCRSSFKEICGAEVAFKLICVMDDKEPEQMLSRYGDLVAIATVGDVMPLTNENRSIVKYGLGLIKARPRVGISAIINSAGIDRNTLNASKISFGIVPRINTAGRMGSALRALDLLLSTDMMLALKIAGELEDDNALRSKTEKQIFKEAICEIEKHGHNHNRVIVVAGENWHMGVIGIVASRICERYLKPTIVLSIDGETAHGSGRSYEGFELFGSISACGDILKKYGGHALAAGVSIKAEKINEFRNRINEYALNNEYVPPVLKIDFKINPAAMSVDMAYSVKRLEPFGFGNPTPVFGLFGVTLSGVTELSGGKHLKLMFKKDETVFQALLFSVSKENFCFETGDVCDLAVSLDLNFYRDNYMLSVQIKSMRLSGDYNDRLFKDIAAFDDFVSGYDIDSERLCPDRQSIALIYRSIAACPVLQKRLEYVFMDKIGYAKTNISLKILRELGLVVYSSGRYSVSPENKKTELTNSAIYRRLKGGDGIDR